MLTNGNVTTSDVLRTIVDHVHVGVLEATVAHPSEHVVLDRFCNKRVVIQSPDIPQTGEDRLFVQSLGVEPAHVPITDSIMADVQRNRGPVDERRNIKVNHLMIILYTLCLKKTTLM